MAEPWLSVIGGGLAATVVTIGFSAWWDSKKQKISEDWEFRRYEANLIHFSTAGLMEAFFSAKSELLYMTSTLELLAGSLNQLSAQVDQIVRQQGGPHMTIADLEDRKRQLLESFRSFNAQQVTLRWNQYEQKGKENHAKAEVHLTTLKSLLPIELYTRLVSLFERLSAPFVWDLPHAKEKLQTLEAALPEVLESRENLFRQLENKLGRNK